MSSMKYRPTLVATALALAIAATSAWAQFRKPEEAIKYRQGAMFVMANHFARIGAMVNGRVPFDADAVRANADIVALLAKLPFAGFIEGTDKGDTKAEAEIWTEPDKFRAATQKMQDEVARLNAAAKTGNLAQIKTAFGAVGESCKSCHDNYRKE
jgi:cytochrome c556